jgi:hypothetical protein
MPALFNDCKYSFGKLISKKYLPFFLVYIGIKVYVVCNNAAYTSTSINFKIIKWRKIQKK